MAWLRADMDDQDKSLVSMLWFGVCGKYETKICRYKNFSKAWIDGSSKQRTVNIIKHATSEQHSYDVFVQRAGQD